MVVSFLHFVLNNVFLLLVGVFMRFIFWFFNFFCIFLF
jgi:hypothetical protein